MTSSLPLAVLDLVPIAEGSSATEALHNSIDLAVQAERLGYRRYWFAEHHLNPGVAGTSPAVVLALVGAATSTIRLGSGAVQMGHRTALATVEEFGLLDVAFPGRIDLGLGRSAGKPPERASSPPAGAGSPTAASPDAGLRDAGSLGAGASTAAVVDGYTANGLRIPPRANLAHLLKSPRFAMQKRLLQLPGAVAQGYTDQVGDVLDLLAGRYLSPEGEEAHVIPGERANVEVWILGSSAGESAQVSGARGLPFAANYHVSPATVLEAVDAYRCSFRPSAVLAQPYVSVSADVVVAEDTATAQRLAQGYGLWVLGIRNGSGAIPFPTPEHAERHAWTNDELALVTDRIETQFVGDPAHVADQLEALRDATGADELIITTMTHEHHDRVRSYELLADEWRRRETRRFAAGSVLWR